MGRQDGSHFIEAGPPRLVGYARVSTDEHDVLRERTVAGMEAAKRRGEHIDRPPALTPAQVREAK